MYYILAIFSSRSETLSFASLLRSYGQIASIISTPKEAGLPCGICVKFMPNVLAGARALIERSHYSTFAGFYSVRIVNGRSEYSRI